MSPSIRIRGPFTGLLVFLALAATIQLTLAQQKSNNNHKNQNINRKSIVFDIKTPKVFYCPQEKPSDLNKMIVKAKPLESLCEFGGKSKPKDEPSDCYNDVDETEFACEEKKRFMVSYMQKIGQSPSTSINLHLRF